MKGLLAEMMGQAAILRIATMEERGGPTAADVRKAQETSDMLGEHGDVLLNGGGKPGQRADLFNRTAHAIAVLAFAPGGVELFGARFEAKMRKGTGERTGIVKGGETAIQIIVEFDKGLFQHFDVPQWNAFVAGLLSRGLTPPVWVPGERPDPIAVMIDFTGLRRAHYDLDRIDFRMCWLADADFTGASLRHARMCCARDASYRGARLDHADFREVQVSGCDFSGATGLDTAMFDGAVYAPSNPPKGLPPEVFARCRPEADPPPAGRRQIGDPQKWPRFDEAPVAVLRNHPLDLLGVTMAKTNTQTHLVLPAQILELVERFLNNISTS